MIRFWLNSVKNTLRMREDRFLDAQDRESVVEAGRKFF